MAIGSLVVVSLKITANKSGFGEYVEYRTILNDATGINERASIKVAGIVAGKIRSIELSGSQALIKFDVLKDIKLTANSILRVKSVGFLGDKYIDIWLGDTSAPRLEEGSFVTSETGGGLDQIGKDASEALKDVKAIAQSIREALKDENGNNLVREIMINIKDFSKNAKEVAESLKNITQGNEQKLARIIDNVEDISAQLKFETDRYQDGSFMNDLEDIGPILSKVNQAASDLKDIIADVKSGKGTVGKLLRDEEVVDKVSETLSGVNRLVGRVNNFKTDIALFTGANNEYGGRTDFNVDLIPSPERFFRLGVVISDYGPELTSERTTTTTVDDNDPVVTNEREVNKSAFKFNVQMGRQFNNTVVRAGIIESSGGLGIDYIFPNSGLRTSLEIFDYQEDVGPQVRLATEIRLYNIFYTRLAGEDLASNADQQSYTISAGLRFSDDDLASLIGILAN